ncbi:protein DEHYDRATION-INDUCED 19 homolog 4-like [Zingiber officinale]|uniref:protein DEHYDRATION-INDUCED 19 homolog 4-like n=1 Tax=Zingiber officinale TaxID=94328 RepID=UPI001C4ABFC9|nr:protein DEHYDRATION-INDUCED 19 homolog 4-like [Zingiber officinale]
MVRLGVQSGSETAPSFARITSPVFPQMVRLGVPAVDSFDWENLMVNEFLDWFDRDDLNPEDLSIYEFEVDGIPRPLTCPYCNEPHDLGSLCSHLVQKHFLESRPAVCPGCDSNQTQMLYHIVAAHRSMLRISFFPWHKLANS